MLSPSSLSVLGPSIGSSSGDGGGGGASRWQNDEYYSNRDIEITHDVVRAAQESWDALPARERIPTNVLFKAYNRVLPTYGIDPDADQHLSRLVFRIGGDRCPGTLWDKFRAVLARMGIEIEIGEEDGAGAGADNEEDELAPKEEAAEMAERGGGAHRHGYHHHDHDHHHADDHAGRDAFIPTAVGLPPLRRAHSASASYRPASVLVRPFPDPDHLEDDQEDSDDNDGDESLHHVAGVRVPSASLMPSSTTRETELTGHSLDSLLPGQLGSSDTTVQLDEEERPPSRPSRPPLLPLPPLPPLPRPQPPQPPPPPLSLPHRPKPKQVTFQSPSRQFIYSPEYSYPSSPSQEQEPQPDEDLAELRYEQTAEDGSAGSGDRANHAGYADHAGDDDILSLPDQDRDQYEALERRADRAQCIWLSTAVVENWAHLANEKGARTATARRHILRHKYFRAWLRLMRRDRDDANPTESPTSTTTTTGTITTTTTSTPAATALQLLPTRLLLSPDNVNDDGTLLAILMPPPNDPPDDPPDDELYGYAVAGRLAAKSAVQYLLKRSISGWVSATKRDRKTESDPAGAAALTANYLGAKVLQRWGQRAAEQQQRVPPRHVVCAPVLRRCLADWQTRGPNAGTERVEGSVGAMLIGHGLDRWDRHHVSQRDGRQSARQLQDSAILRWIALASPPPSYHFHHYQHPHQHRHPSPGPEPPPPADAIIDPTKLAQSDAIFFNTTASRVLSLWRNQLQYEHYERYQTSRHWATETGLDSLAAWKQNSAKEVLRDGWARRADYYLQVARALDRWCGQPNQAYRHQAQAAYVRVKREGRARLADRALRVWRRRTDEADRLDDLAAGNHTDDVSGHLRGRPVDAWAHLLETDSDEPAMRRFADWQLGAWCDAHRDGEAAESQCDDIWAEQAQALCLPGWILTARKLKGLEHMVEDATQQADRKLLREALDGWVVTVRPGPEQPAEPATPAAAAAMVGARRRTPVRLVIRRNPHLLSSIATPGRTPWTAPAVSMRSGGPLSGGRDLGRDLGRNISSFRRHRPPIETFEAGDPHQETGLEEAGGDEDGEEEEEGEEEQGGRRRNLLTSSVVGGWASTTPRTPGVAKGPRPR